MTQISPLQKSEQHTLELENEGRLTLPAEVLRRVNLKQSDRSLAEVLEEATALPKSPS